MEEMDFEDIQMIIILKVSVLLLGAKAHFVGMYDISKALLI